MMKNAVSLPGKAEETFSDAVVMPEPLSDDKKEMAGAWSIFGDMGADNNERLTVWARIWRFFAGKRKNRQEHGVPPKPEWYKAIRVAVIVTAAIIICISPFAVAARGGSLEVASASETDTSQGEAALLTSSTLSTAPVWTKLDTALFALMDSQNVSVPQIYYEEGMTEDVAIPLIQQRLMDLGYMEEDEPTATYGAVMKASVQKFERKSGFEMDGILTQFEYDLLMSDSAQNYSVSLGAEGTDVGELQTRLLELGYLENVTGEFGIYTEQAVEAFQKKNGLTIDGTIGRDTYELLYSDQALANALSFGDQSEEIKTYQARLKELGYFSGEINGYFGSDMVTAIKAFQNKNGLIADGAIGSVTSAALISENAQPCAYALGDSGDGVMAIQQRLVSLNYMSGATGYFGEHTETAVKRFQQQNGLSVDGRVGSKTSSVLFSDSAKKYVAPSTSTGTTPSTGTSPSTGTTPPSGTPATDSPNSSKVEEFIAVAMSKLGCEYVLGAKGPNTFDCSGFVYWCLKQVGVNQSYMTSAGWKSTTKYPIITSMSELQRGDIICFNGHVGICLGNGQMIDASSSMDQIRITSLSSSSYWSRNFIKGCRVF